MRRIIFSFIILVSIPFLIASLATSFAQEREHVCQLIALDVGQGDAILFRTSDGQDVLVDTGPGERVIPALERHLPFGDQDIELFIMTHPDADHIAGAAAVFEKYDVRTVLESGVIADTRIDDRRRTAQSAENANVKIARAGQQFTVGENLTIEILWPKGEWIDTIDATDDDMRNETSVVARIICNGSTAMLTGDAPVSVESRLVDGDRPLTAAALKLGHHGARTSTSSEFLRSVEPTVALISAGANNRYGHPTSDVLERLKLFDIGIRRTDQEGDIVLRSDGRGGWE